MLLSEAIRLGAMNSKQAFYKTASEHGRCAWGAALAAIGKPESSYAAAGQFFPIADTIETNPVNGEDWLVLSIVRWLNDEEHWTRPRIADWVATVEPAQAQPEAERAPVAVVSRGPELKRGTVGAVTRKGI